ncbi:MAG TPA: alpha/beta fold hydrolase [Herpetosiphonaceae bacterium]
MDDPPVSHHTARLRGLDFHYVKAGSGPLVVLLHGWPEFWYSWRYQIAPLAQTHTVVALDQRGYNLSAKPRGRRAYRVDELVGDVLALLDHLGAERAALVGHDWGGVIAWQCALLHPARVERLAALNMPHPALFRRALLLNPAQMARSWYMGFFQLPWLPELMFGDPLRLPRMLGWHRRPDVFTAEALRRYAEAWRQPGAMTASINWYRALPYAGFVPKDAGRRRLALPTLMIFGTADQAIGSRLTHGTERYVADLRIRYLGGVSHWVQQEAAAAVNAELTAFLGDGADAAQERG